MAKTCISCGKKKGLLQSNYAADDIASQNPFPDRISPKSLPGSAGDFLCPECAVQVGVRCSIHGPVTYQSIGPVHRAKCQPCVAEKDVSRATSYRHSTYFLSVSEPESVLVESLKQTTALLDSGKLVFSDDQQLLYKAIPLLRHQSARVRLGAIRVVSHRGLGIARDSEAYHKVCPALLEDLDNPSLSSELRHAALAGLASITGLQAIIEFVKDTLGKQRLNDAQAAVTSFWIAHTQGLSNMGLCQPPRITLGTLALLGASVPANNEDSLSADKLISELAELYVDRAGIIYSSWVIENSSVPTIRYFQDEYYNSPSELNQTLELVARVSRDDMAMWSTLPEDVVRAVHVLATFLPRV